MADDIYPAFVAHLRGAGIVAASSVVRGLSERFDEPGMGDAMLDHLANIARRVTAELLAEFHGA